MKMREVANAFDMKVKDFAKMLGFSRQALHSCGKSLGNTRKEAVIEYLVMLNEKMYRDEQAEVSRRLEARYKAIDVFERMMKED